MMHADEITKLSRESLTRLLKLRRAMSPPAMYLGVERRRRPRWPFPGQVEVRLAGQETALPHFFDCGDMSETGMGIFGECSLSTGSIVELSIHMPEMTLYGRAVVRYCAKAQGGHTTGVEFLFDK